MAGVMLSGSHLSAFPPEPQTPVDPCAEFTLRVAAIAQSVIPGATWPERWYLFPALKEASWDEAREHLTSAPKPVLVTPFADPGYLGVWPTSTANGAFAKQMANQVAYYDAKIPRMGMRDEDTLVLGTPTGEFTCTIGEFRRWTREYALLARVVLVETTDPRVAQILILEPARTTQPLNTYREFPPPDQCGCGHPEHHH